MLNLAEYRSKPQTFADLLPWAALVAPGVVLNKDGSFQRTARFRGPDLDSATPAELVAVSARLNTALRRLGSGWAVFAEAQRVPARSYPMSSFPDPVSELVDAERRAQFEEEGSHFESRFFLTFTFLPPADEAARAEGWAGMIDPQIIAISLEGPLGQSTYVRLGGLVLIVLAALFRPVGAPATLFGAIMVAGSFAVTGHATRDPQWLLGGLITFHLLAVAYWFGALAPLHRLTRFDGGASHAAHIADRFGKQASIIVPMLILAGAGFAYVLLGGIEPLWSTGYGRMLLVKIAIVAVVLGIAALNKWRFVPALAADGGSAAPAFRRSLRVEAVVFLLVFAATAFLTTSFTVPEAG